MTVQQWLDKVKADAPKLESLIASYHPSARRMAKVAAIGPITAPDSEAMCEVVRGKIKREHPEDPVIQFRMALSTHDVGKIHMLLDQTWFGVPETDACWSIDGFAEAIEILDDLPEEE